MDSGIMSELPYDATKLIYGQSIDFTPLISIAIPTYKRFFFLQEAIESALSQEECSHYEVIILDNDQSDRILEVVGSFDPSKIAVYQNSTNLGMWGNMNRALDLAKGEWILMLHDDDLLLPNALQVFERIISSFNNQEIGCLAGGVESLYEGSIRPLWDRQSSHFRFPIAAKWYSTDNVVHVLDNMHFIDTPKFCSSFFRRRYIKKIGGWDAQYYGYADIALFLRIVKDKKLFVCKEIFGRLRSHDDNDSHPNKLWKTYPVKAAQRLLKDYADDSTVMGRNMQTTIERCYTTALWKRRYTSEERRAYAEELLLLIVQKPSRRFLLKNMWFLNMTMRLYLTLRPMLGWLSQATLLSRQKSALHGTSVRTGRGPVRR